MLIDDSARISILAGGCDRAEPPPGLPARAVSLLDARPAVPARARRRRVFVVKRDEADEVVAVTDRLPAVLRVDQLLTIGALRMNSTDRPRARALFAEYYLLKAKPHRTAVTATAHRARGALDGSTCSERHAGSGSLRGGRRLRGPWDALADPAAGSS